MEHYFRVEEGTKPKLLGYTYLLIAIMNFFIYAMAPYNRDIIGPIVFFNIMVNLLLLESHLRPIQKVFEFIRWRKEVAQKRINYTTFRDSVKTGEITDFNEEAKRIL